MTHRYDSSRIEDGSAHPISVLSGSVASYFCHFMLTLRLHVPMTHNDDS